MKKTISIIAIALCLVLCIPSSPCFAYDVQAVYARTYNSVQGYWDDPDYQTWQNNLTSLSSSNPNYETIVDIVANYRSMSGYPASYDDFEHVAIFLNLDETVVNFYFCDWSDFLWVENYGSIESSPVHNFVTCFLGRPANSDGAFGSVALSQPTVFTAGSWNINSLGSSEGAIWHVDTKGTILYCNFDLFCFNDYTEKGFTNPYSYQNIYTHYEDLENFMNPDLPYVNGDGVIVNPNAPEVESNLNHMFFKDCEIGFCYPKSSPAPVSFGGAYFYIKYTVDDWVVNHISDYSLVFYADAEVGNEVTNTIRYEIALDPDGCVTIPFSRIWSTPLTSKGFSVLVTDREIEDNFYKAYLYSLSPSGFVNFGAKAAASNQNSISGALNALTSGGIQSFLYYINGDQIDFYSAMSEIGTSIATKYNPYVITAFTLLTDGTDNSGLFEMQFDLVAGTEDVTDTGGLVNPDPFIPEDDPDFTPPAPTPGNSTTPGYNIVPSGYWQGTINGVIGYDPGYRDLKSDIDKDPDGNFTQYLDPMKNQTVGSWFLSFVNDMPAEMKALLITGTGVGIFFGIYRFIRRG